MPLMEWNDKLSVGVAKFDAEHHRLVDMVNALFEAVRGGRGRDALGVILNDLITYTETHFAHEEKAMRDAEFPEIESHIEEHRALTEQVREIQRKYVDGASATLSMEVMNFLKNWLVKHIQGSDRRYTPFMRERGIGA